MVVTPVWVNDSICSGCAVASESTAGFDLFTAVDKADMWSRSEMHVSITRSPGVHVGSLDGAG
jgi:hypothetical protein